MKCVFCNTDWSADTNVCPSCEDYKGLITIEPIRIQGFTSLDEALRDATGIMEEARQAYADECEHENLRHTDGSAHIAFCPDCDLEFMCECEEH
jgi:hypothetical protein